MEVFREQFTKLMVGFLRGYLLYVVVPRYARIDIAKVYA